MLSLLDLIFAFCSSKPFAHALWNTCSITVNFSLLPLFSLAVKLGISLPLSSFYWRLFSISQFTNLKAEVGHMPSIYLYPTSKSLFLHSLWLTPISLSHLAVMPSIITHSYHLLTTWTKPSFTEHSSDWCPVNFSQPSSVLILGGFISTSNLTSQFLISTTQAVIFTISHPTISVATPWTF